MDEQQWLQGSDLWGMLEHPCASGKPSDRKLRLFACACCRRIWHLFTDRRLRVAVGVAEQFADRRATHQQLRNARAEVAAAMVSPEVSPRYYSAVAVWWAVTERLNQRCFGDAAKAALFAADHQAVWEEEIKCQCRLLRCLFGNPFRLLSPRSFPPHVVGLAHAIAQVFPTVSEDYAILADALEELGAADAAAHCREKLHARGCHVLDWIRAIE
jgi:hypothetical protein